MFLTRVTGKKAKFAQTFRKSSRRRGVFFGFSGFGVFFFLIVREHLLLLAVANSKARTYFFRFVVPCISIALGAPPVPPVSHMYPWGGAAARERLPQLLTN